MPPRTWVRAAVYEVDLRALREAKVSLKNESYHKRGCLGTAHVKREISTEGLEGTTEPCPREGNPWHWKGKEQPGDEILVVFCRGQV